MTTNYLLVELTAKMEHEERLQKSVRICEQLRLLPQTAQRSWRSTLSSLRQLFTNKFANQSETNSTGTALTASITKPATPEPIQLRSLCKNEEEWVKVFRMIHNRKLSVEQATQLLSALNGQFHEPQHC